MNFDVDSEFSGVTMEVTREKIQRFAIATLDYNPLHFSDDWMTSSSFDGTQFDQVIGHGLMTYSLMTRVVANPVFAAGGWHDRCEARFRSPVYPGDTVTAKGVIREIYDVDDLRYYVAELVVENQRGTTVATGEALGHLSR